MKKWSRKKCWPYVATYGIWLFILLLIVLTGKTEAGQPYPVVTGVILSIIAALIFSIPIWLVQAVFLFLRKKREPLFGGEIEQLKSEHEENNLPQTDCATSKQENDTLSQGVKPSTTSAEIWRSEELRQKERDREEQHRLQTLREENVRNRLAESARQEAKLERQREAHRLERQEKIQGMDYSALLEDAILFASEQMYITKEEMQDEYPGVPSETKRRLLEDLYELKAIRPRPQDESWLSLLDHQHAQKLIAEIKGSKIRKQAPPQMGSFNIDTMEGHEFEHFCADLLQRNGFTDVEVTKASGDFGIDILARKDGVSYAIQCKCYSDTVGNHAVQEALSGAQYYHRMVAAVMTNNYFTSAAIETAQKTNVLLWDRDAVLKMAK